MRFNSCFCSDDSFGRGPGALPLISPSAPLSLYRAPSPATSVDPSRQSRRRPYGSSRRAPPPATTTDAPDLRPLPVSPAPSVRPHSNPCAIAPLHPSPPRRITSTSKAMQPQGTAVGNPEPESHSTKIGITCWPLDSAMPGPLRYVVHADLVN